MNRLQVFNHHCLLFDSAERADEAMSGFLKLCLRANRLGFAAIVMSETIDSKWFGLELAPNYFFRDWYRKHGKQGLTKDLVSAFRSIATKTPLFSVEDIAQGADLFEVSETTTKQKYAALRAAAWFDVPLSGFPTRSLWKKNPIIVTVSTMNDACEVNSERKELINWYSFEVIDSMTCSLEQERVSAINSGVQLFESREKFFPFLRFCGKAPSQIRNGLQGTVSIVSVSDTLRYLNSFCEQWADGRIPSYSNEALRAHGIPHAVSGESNPTLENPDLRRLREFSLENGEKAIFQNHVKLTSGIRLHFYPDAKQHIIYIGYIGPHLPTAKYS